MVSSGIRLGAWEYLRWKHVIPLINEHGDIIAAKMIVYAGDREEYYVFLIPEAYFLLKDCLGFVLSFSACSGGFPLSGSSGPTRLESDSSSVLCFLDFPRSSFEYVINFIST